MVSNVVGTSISRRASPRQCRDGAVAEFLRSPHFIATNWHHAADGSVLRAFRYAAPSVTTLFTPPQGHRICAPAGVPAVYLSSAEVYGAPRACLMNCDIRVPARHNARIEYALGNDLRGDDQQQPTARTARDIVRLSTSWVRGRSRRGFVMPTFVQQRTRRRRGGVRQWAATTCFMVGRYRELPAGAGRRSS